VHVIWHQVPFLDLRLLLSRQPVEHLAEVPAQSRLGHSSQLAKERAAAPRALDADTAVDCTQIREFPVPHRIAVLRGTRAETDEQLLQPWPPPSATACGALIKDATVAVPRARAKTIAVKIITRFMAHTLFGLSNECTVNL
jgi:hypothetical protein